MEMHRYWLCILLLVMAAGCDDISTSNGSATDASLERPSSYTLVWQDEFDSGTQPDPSKWNFDIGSQIIGDSVWGNNERQYYTDATDNIYIANGKLVIQAIHEVHPDAPSGFGILATSARLKSDTPGYFAAIGDDPYGYYEFRARLHCVPGSWPALWLLGKHGDWPARGEIDVVEWAGKYHSQTEAASTFHTTATYNGTLGIQNSQIHRLSNMCADYHLFQLHWLENSIVMGINGRETLSFTKLPSYGQDEWPFDQPGFLIMNLAVGGNLGGNVNPADIADMKLEIDYVRVWKKP